MRDNATGRALFIASVSTLALAVAALSIPLAVLGAALAATYAGLRISFGQRTRALRLTATRQVLGSIHYRDVPVETCIHWTSDDPSIHIELVDDPPEGLTLLGTEGRIVRYRAEHLGPVQFASTSFHLRDSHGLFEERFTVETPAQLYVVVSRAELAEAANASRRHRLDARRSDALGRLAEADELAGIREYAAGDRMRDIDWKRTAQLQRLVTRASERQSEVALFVLLDASPTMRAKRGAASKSEKACGIAVELAELGVAQGIAVGLAAADGTTILDEAALASHATHAKSVAGKVAKLPASYPVVEPPQPSSWENLRETPEPLVQLAKLNPSRVARVPPLLGLTQRLAARAAPGSLRVIVLTDLESSPRASVQAISILRAHGHKVVLGLLEAEAFLQAPEKPALRDVEVAYQRLQTRDAAIVRLQALDVDIVRLRPSSSVADLIAERRYGPLGSIHGRNA